MLSELLRKIRHITNRKPLETKSCITN